MPSQQNSVFAPALTVRGPVYNSMGALPSFVANLPAWAILGGIAVGSHIAAKKMRSKIPYAAGALAAFLYWKNSAIGLPAGNFILPDGTSVHSSQVTPVGSTGTSFAYNGATYTILSQTSADQNGVAQYFTDVVASVSGG